MSKYALELGLSAVEALIEQFDVDTTGSCESDGLCSSICHIYGCIAVKETTIRAALDRFNEPEAPSQSEDDPRFKLLKAMRENGG